MILYRESDKGQFKKGNVDEYLEHSSQQIISDEESFGF